VFAVLSERRTCNVHGGYSLLSEQAFAKMSASNQQRFRVAYFHGRYAVSKELLNLLLSLDRHMSVVAIAALLVEQHALRHDELQLAYYTAMATEEKVALAGGPPPFPLFAEGWPLAKHIPSETWLRKRISFVHQVRYEFNCLFLQLQVPPIWMPVLKGDGSYKLVKRIRHAEEAGRAFKCLYTLMAGDCTVVGQWFLATDEAEQELLPLLQRVCRRIEDLGGNVKVFYTDSCCQQRSMIEQAFDSFFQRLAPHPGSKTKLKEMVEPPCLLAPVVLSSQDVAETIFTQLIEPVVLSSQRKVLAISVKWTSDQAIVRGQTAQPVE
jgi:hypothetical protein